VSDVARAFINVLECPHINLTINIGSGTSTSLSELMKIFENSLGKPINWNFQPLRIIDRLRFLLDIQLASELLGWVPGVNLEEGIRALLENSNKII
jgi:UDP-glucose 4-epimerase